MGKRKRLYVLLLKEAFRSAGLGIFYSGMKKRIIMLHT